MAKILVIDDDPAIVEFVRTVLETDYDVACASDGEAGLLMCRERTPDLIITDIFMPFMDGLEILREARTGCPDAKIIAITGHGNTGAKSYLKLAGDLGAKACLSKPFSADALLDAVRDALN